ncbi:MAG: hypothetical protein ACREOZ_04565, partial [Gloeomargaritales cyanobacterium]
MNTPLTDLLSSATMPWDPSQHCYLCSSDFFTILPQSFRKHFTRKNSVCSRLRKCKACNTYTADSAWDLNFHFKYCQSRRTGRGACYRIPGVQEEALVARTQSNSNGVRGGGESNGAKSLAPPSTQTMVGKHTSLNAPKSVRLSHSPLTGRQHSARDDNIGGANFLPPAEIVMVVGNDLTTSTTSTVAPQEGDHLRNSSIRELDCFAVAGEEEVESEIKAGNDGGMRHSPSDVEKMIGALLEEEGQIAGDGANDDDMSRPTSLREELVVDDDSEMWNDDSNMILDEGASKALAAASAVLERGPATLANSDISDDFLEIGSSKTTSSCGGASVESKNENNHALAIMTRTSFSQFNTTNPTNLKPFELELITYVKKNNLKPSVFNDFMNMSKRALVNGYNFEGPTYKTCLNRLEALFGEEAGGPPLHDSMYVSGFPPVDIYHNDLCKLARSVFADPELMKNGLWGYDRDARVFGELNTGTWWKEAEAVLAGRLNGGTSSFNTMPTNHYLAPTLLFDDATVCDGMGRLSTQAVLASFGNCNGKI